MRVALSWRVRGQDGLAERLFSMSVLTILINRSSLEHVSYQNKNTYNLVDPWSIYT